jgi:hypothetical protein
MPLTIAKSDKKTQQTKVRKETKSYESEITIDKWWHGKKRFS